MIFAVDPVTTTVQGPLGGWDVVVLQFGAFGLLSYVIVILAPQLLRELMADRKARDQSELEERTKRDKDAREERQAREMTFVNVVTVLESKFGERNSQVIRQMELERESCERRHSNIEVSLKDTRHATKQLEQQIALLADGIWQDSADKVPRPNRPSRRATAGGQTDAS
jgi:hypothetical protein